jgi:hypothetical protein
VQRDDVVPPVGHHPDDGDMVIELNPAELLAARDDNVRRDVDDVFAGGHQLLGQCERSTVVPSRLKRSASLCEACRWRRVAICPNETPHFLDP